MITQIIRFYKEFSRNDVRKKTIQGQIRIYNRLTLTLLKSFGKFVRDLELIEVLR